MVRYYVMSYVKNIWSWFIYNDNTNNKFVEHFVVMVVLAIIIVTFKEIHIFKKICCKAHYILQTHFMRHD